MEQRSAAHLPNCPFAKPLRIHGNLYSYNTAELNHLRAAHLPNCPFAKPLRIHGNLYSYNTNSNRYTDTPVDHGACNDEQLCIAKLPALSVTETNLRAPRDIGGCFLVLHNPSWATTDLRTLGSVFETVWCVAIWAATWTMMFLLPFCRKVGELDRPNLTGGHWK